MSLRIAGMGWVTPLGSDLDEVWDRLARRREAAPANHFEIRSGEHAIPRFRVPARRSRSARSSAAAPIQRDFAIRRRRPAWPRCDDAGIEF